MRFDLINVGREMEWELIMMDEEEWEGDWVRL